MKETIPRVTVLMPVYNGEKYLNQAIESILTQTYTDFELLIIDDASVDSSVELVRSYNDKRIKLVRNTVNMNLIATLNKGLKLANGEYIVRMDQDDISFPNRLKVQVEFMDLNKEVAISGSWIKTFGTKKSRVIKPPTSYKDIKSNLIFGNCLAHPSVIMRKSSLDKFGLSYNQKFIHAEDYELWQRASLLVEVRNIPKVLLKYRINEQGISRVYNEIQLNTIRLVCENILKQLEVNYSENDLENYYNLCSWNYNIKINNVNKLNDFEEILLRLYTSNEQKKVFDSTEFNKAIFNCWFRLCSASSSYLGMNALRCFNSSEISSFYELSFYRKINLLIKCSIKMNLKKPSL
ncbi:glycosyl transferase family 2 [Paenibacillus curdlanolyticus YK9]|uniref:Glycosyl transferase family 2 n=1 Tax=Paenibacillus curdlanolyticus YK9 TaxID=717606 RepID=E0I8C8_9BACL|nr:glycosyltransferase [Paenibacillus curdlanolyticus]EFM11433.1 glycosyl transferase family 2 [Paenibacillus curdlanolyticus YK9]